MKKMISALVAVSALAVVAPAMAQVSGGVYLDLYDGGYDRGYDRGYGYGYGGGDLRREIERLDDRIDRARANRTISYREAQRLEWQVNQLRRSYYGYMRDGRLSRWERDTLDQQIDRVRYQLRRDRQDRDGYGGGYRRY